LGPALILLFFFEKLGEFFALLDLVSKVGGLDVGLFLFVEGLYGQGSVESEFVYFGESDLFAMVVIFRFGDKQGTFHDGYLFLVVHKGVEDNLRRIVIIEFAHLPK
jgi:hypothetical protein